jgi:flagellar biosynthesis/type III secretory pathway protein FliH
MALAVLNLAPDCNLVSRSRVLSPHDWGAVSDVIRLRAQALAALEQAHRKAASAATEHLRQRALELEQRMQRSLLLKALALQHECERQQRALRERFVDSMMSCLNALLTPVPAQFFARVQASAAAMVGEAPALALHVSAHDEAAAREALGLHAERVQLVIDPDLAAGACFLETAFGRIQAGLATQLEGLKQALQGWWDGEQPAPEARPDAAP